MTLFNYFKILSFFTALLILTGCSEKTKFVKGDIKDDFCGVHINFQYCKCAFHNDYCDSIGLSRGAANDYVNEQYNNWVSGELNNFKDNCRKNNGIPSGNICKYCGDEETVENGKCVAREALIEDDEDKDNEEENGDQEGDCKYDSDCEPICEGDVMWKMGCNARTNTCEKTFDTDCAGDIENFGELSFSKICQSGECVRDTESINAMRDELTKEKQLWSDTVKKTNAIRDDIRDAMLDANKNCINGIADMTNVAIIEFSTRVASVLAGGIPDIAAMSASAAEKAAGLVQEHVKNLAGAAVDYAGEALNRLYNYQQGEPAEEAKKLKPHEYIKLNCDLYNYFKNVMAESDVDLETALENARQVDAMLQALPE